jgi:hypothetical protein
MPVSETPSRTSALGMRRGDAWWASEALGAPLQQIPAMAPAIMPTPPSEASISARSSRSDGGCEVKTTVHRPTHSATALLRVKSRIVAARTGRRHQTRSRSAPPASHAPTAEKITAESMIGSMNRLSRVGRASIRAYNPDETAVAEKNKSHDLFDDTRSEATAQMAATEAFKPHVRGSAASGGDGGVVGGDKGAEARRKSEGIAQKLAPSPEGTESSTEALPSQCDPLLLGCAVEV